MKLDTKAAGFTLGIFWGGSIFLVGIANLIWPDYGLVFLQLAASLYPGYDATASFVQVVIGTLYGLVDGFVGGVVAAWVYNVFVPGPTAATSS